MDFRKSLRWWTETAEMMQSYAFWARGWNTKWLATITAATATASLSKKQQKPIHKLEWSKKIN